MPAGEAMCRVRAGREQQSEGQTENGVKGSSYMKNVVSQHTSLTKPCL